MDFDERQLKRNDNVEGIVDRRQRLQQPPPVPRRYETRWFLCLPCGFAGEEKKNFSTTCCKECTSIVAEESSFVCRQLKAGKFEEKRLFWRAGSASVWVRKTQSPWKATLLAGATSVLSSLSRAQRLVRGALVLVRVVCEDFSFFRWENSLQSATSVRMIQIDAALFSCPYFFSQPSRKQAVKEFSFGQLTRHPREQPEKWRKTFRVRFSLFVLSAAYRMWKGRLLFLRRGATRGERKRKKKVQTRCEEGKPGFFPFNLQFFFPEKRKIGKSFLLLLSACYSIHFLRTHQHQLRRSCVRMEFSRLASEVNKANNNDTGTCYSSRCVIIITQKDIRWRWAYAMFQCRAVVGQWTHSFTGLSRPLTSLRVTLYDHPRWWWCGSHRGCKCN